MPARPADQKVKILYIEDNRENRMLVRAVLEAAGYLIVDAEDGLSGIEAAIREEPALILLDINLPGVDGYEIVAILKSFPNLASTPVTASAGWPFTSRSPASTPVTGSLKCSSVCASWRTVSPAAGSRALTSGAVASTSV